MDGNEESVSRGSSYANRIRSEAMGRFLIDGALVFRGSRRPIRNGKSRAVVNIQWHEGGHKIKLMAKVRLFSPVCFKFNPNPEHCSGDVCT